MKDDTTHGIENRTDFTDTLTQMLRAGSQQLIHQALEAELAEFMSRFSNVRTIDGKAGVVRNGYHPEREIQTGIGPVSVQIPKVRSKTGKALSFQSALVPPYVRKTKSLESAIPWLYLKGISTGEMGSALKALLGDQASGLSAASVSRLKQQWSSQYAQFCEQSLADESWVYVWADGIYSGLRGEDAKLCALVVIGVNTRGEKRFIAIEDGFRESTESWKGLLLGLKDRGMRAPQLAIGDGAMGFWSALDELYPETRHQRCWVHKTANVLNCFPKKLHSPVKSAIQQIWMAHSGEDAQLALERFVKTYEAKYPKAVITLEKDRETLLTFYDYPAVHWQSLRTTNPIESTFATIRHRTKRTKGCLTRDGMVHMMFKLAQCAEQNWRKQRGFKLLEKVHQGVSFKDGIEVQTNQLIAA